MRGREQERSHERERNNKAEKIMKKERINKRETLECYRTSNTSESISHSLIRNVILMILGDGQKYYA